MLLPDQNKPKICHKSIEKVLRCLFGHFPLQSIHCSEQEVAGDHTSFIISH